MTARPSLLLPGSLARRFALAAAALVAVSLLLVSLASWWLINQQHDRALQELADKETQFHAATVGSNLRALAARMTEVAGSTILATGLVDSAGRETYLVPYLAGLRQINGLPVQVVFTDFEGKEIASNGAADFSADQMLWLRNELPKGRAASAIFREGKQFALVALEPMTYARTRSPEGALLYKLSLSDIEVGDAMRLEWTAADAPTAASVGYAAKIATPPVFDGLQFRVRGPPPASSAMLIAPQYTAIFLIALLLFTAVVLIGLRLANVLTRDLRRLEAFASRFISSELSSERAPEAGSAEVASLAASINEMLDRLHAQHAALLREREKLSDLADALKAADRRKDEFLAMLAHELRNPLAPISTGAELLKITSQPDTSVMRTSDIIARQARHMTKIVDDLLDVSRVTRGLVSLDRSDIDVATIVQEAVDQTRPLLDDKGHTLTVRVPEEPLTVFADAARLVQVVSNLLNNAAKYTPDGGRIALTVEATPTEVCLTLSDTGMGISAELMPDIFDLFTQGSRTSDRAQGGLGLGLALVKNLVELHGGSVRVDSAGPGTGSTFIVRLPRLRHSSVPAASADAAPAAPARALTIMVVDDNVDAAQMLATMLEMDGHQVPVAFDGPSALETAERQVIDVFILDLGLPGMSGSELARTLRSMPKTRNALLIALTGYGRASDLEETAAAGFDHHLIKPVEFATLRALLEPRSRS